MTRIEPKPCKCNQLPKIVRMNDFRVMLFCDNPFCDNEYVTTLTEECLATAKWNLKVEIMEGESE